MIRCSRSLLLPGPQPPLTHFGASLLRHVVGTGLRFALHSLGAPMPPSPPVRIVGLRVYLDRAQLAEALADHPSGDELVAAAIEPQGAGSLPRAAAARGAATFHRARLRWSPRREPMLEQEIASSDEVLENRLNAALDAWLPALQDAVLGELLAALERRAARAGGAELSACRGTAAAAFVAGDDEGLASLGPPDPFLPSWAGAPEVAGAARALGPDLPPASAHRLRGRFRETYRRALNDVRAAHQALAASAVRKGFLASVGDAFFFPFDLAGDLAAAEPPQWLEGAVASNRAEYQRFADAESPPERLEASSPDETVDDRDRWLAGPLWPAL